MTPRPSWDIQKLPRNKTTNTPWRRPSRQANLSSMTPTAPLPKLPSWLAPRRGGAPEDAPFRTGALLAILDILVHHPGVPQALLRDRLALQSAETAMIALGRPERAAQLRDEVHLARPGDTLGPGGTVFASFRTWARTPITGGHSGISPLGAAITALGGSDLADLPAATMAADSALAAALRWPHPLPLLSTSLRRADPDGAALHQALMNAGRQALILATDLTRRASHLAAIAPKLRAKPSAQALGLFLTEDALSPTIALSPQIRHTATPMTDRAARRLCDRLCTLGAIRELTGRSAFRLYGL